MQASVSASDCQDDLLQRVRAAAFRLLLDTDAPVHAAAVEAQVDADPAAVGRAIDELDRQGLMRRDESGAIVGSYGLSVVPSQDAIQFDGRRFWTWCAKTSLGVLSALDRGGLVVATSPGTGRELRVTFEGSRPRSEEGVVVFWPSSELRTSCSSVVEEFCPNFSFFESAEAAEAWARTNDVLGEVLSLDEAAERSVGHWRPLVAFARL
jgi:hypothetical protein